jgi:serine/threonine protein kinase
MDAERWLRIEQVFQRAVEASGDARAAILAQSCGDDASLRQEVESLLVHYAQGPTFIETPAAVSLSRKSGMRLGHYRVLEEIAGGGMGVVYKAEDTKLGRIVALKFLARYHSAGSEAIARFRSEARVASSLNHPNVCVIYDIEEDAGEQFIAMEFVEGRTLAALLTDGPLDADTVLHVGSQIADGLAAAHRKGIIHRDIKPANIIVTTTGLVKVLDFGLAKLLDRERSVASGALTDTGPIAGTLPYMSPEQLRGTDVDSRADLFALGTVLYEMATGQRPFTSATAPDLIDRILHRQPVAARELNGDIAPGLAAIIDKCLEKDPARRYQDADDVAVELRRIPTASQTIPRRMPAWMAVTIAAASAAALVAVWSLAGARNTPAAPVPWEQLTMFPDSATSPALSPDGRMLTFVRGSSTFVGPGNIYVKSLPDGEPRQLTNDLREKQDPLFSPDGSHVLYTTGPLPYDVWSVPVAGGTPQLMMPNAGTLTWTGGGRVMFAEVRGIPHMAIVTATESRDDVRSVYVPARTSGMAHRAYLSPDRMWVVIAEMDTAGQGWLPCRLVPFDGSSSGTPIGPSSAACTSAAWSPDGAWMYLSAQVGGSYHIWRQRFPNGDPEQITFGPTQEEGIAMGADGRSLITSVGGAQSTLSIRDANGERKIDSEHTVTGPAFSTDGRTLFYLLQKQLRNLDRQSGDLWAVDVASSQRRQLLAGHRVVSYALSPDGRYVAATVLAADGGSELWLSPLDRNAATRVEWNTDVVGVLFNPAGGLFIVARDGNSDVVYQTDLDGTNSRKVIADPVASIPIAASPSGKWLLVKARLPGGDAASSGIVAYPIDGGTPVTVFNSIWSSARWTADGKGFQMRFARQNTTEMLIATVAVSDDQELPVLPPGGLQTAHEAAQLPGTSIVTSPVAWAPDIALVDFGPDLSTMAIIRTAVHRNLYRVPLP